MDLRTTRVLEGCMVIRAVALHLERTARRANATLDARARARWLHGVLYMRGDSNGGWGRAVSVSRTDAHSPDPDTKGAPSRTWGTPGLRLGI